LEVGPDVPGDRWSEEAEAVGSAAMSEAGGLGLELGAW
jgi:hypothetical protein